MKPMVCWDAVFLLEHYGQIGDAVSHRREVWDREGIPVEELSPLVEVALLPSCQEKGEATEKQEHSWGEEIHNAKDSKMSERRSRSHSWQRKDLEEPWVKVISSRLSHPIICRHGSRGRHKLDSDQTAEVMVHQ
jgi:hypothetical protein